MLSVPIVKIGAIAKPNNSSGIEHKPDMYLAWIPETDNFIELPSDFFNGIVGCNKRIPRKLYI